MGAVGILIALRERDRSGEGQFVDCSMFDGALSWLGLVAAELLATGRDAGAGRAAAGGSLQLLSPVRVRRRMGRAGSARTEVLEGLVRRRRPTRPGRQRVRPAGLGVPRGRV